MNRPSVKANRRQVRTMLFISAVPMAFSAVAFHSPGAAHAQNNAQSPDTITKQYPAIPSTTRQTPAPSVTKPLVTKPLVTKPLLTKPLLTKPLLTESSSPVTTAIAKAATPTTTAAARATSTTLPDQLALRPEDALTTPALIPLLRNQTPDLSTLDSEAIPENLAQTGVVSLDVLFAGLTLLILGTGFVLGIKPLDET